jgi:hypothetical protein
MAGKNVEHRFLGSRNYTEYKASNNNLCTVGVDNLKAFINLNGVDFVSYNGVFTTIENLTLEELVITGNALIGGAVILAPNSSPPSTAGALYYDPVAQTVSSTTGVSDVTVQIGQEIHYQVINNTGSTIDNGTPVHTSNVDATTGLVEISKANAISPFTSLSTIGLTTEDIDDGEIGMVTSFGIVRDIDTSGLTIGRPVYLDATFGGMTGTKPLSPNAIVLLGTCLVSDANVGQMHVEINRFTRPLANKSYSFTSNGIGAGTYYVGGFYDAPAASVTLTQASPGQSHGSANNAYGAHAFIVAGGAGTVDTGTVGIKVTGASITDAGVLTPVDDEILTLDIVGLSTDEYLETNKKWVGSISFSTFTTTGSPTAYSVDFNYGLCKYEDFGNKDFSVNKIEVVGLAGASDTSFDIHLLKHDNIGWTYHATAFDPGNGVIVDWGTDMGSSDNLVNGENFAWKRSTLAEFIDGSGSEGVIVKIITGTNNSVQAMDVHIVGEIESF